MTLTVSLSSRLTTINLWNAKSQKTILSRYIRSFSTSAVSDHTSENDTSPDSVHEETESGDAAYTTYVRSRSLPTSHHLLLHTSAIRLHTSSFLQLFIHHQSYGHTFPISQKTSEPKVHEVSRYSRIFRMIAPSHFYLSSCLVYCYGIAVLVPYAAILSRPIHTDSSSYTVPSVQEVF